MGLLPKHSTTLRQSCSGSFSKETCRDLDINTCGTSERKPKTLSYGRSGWSPAREQLRRRNTSAVEGSPLVQRSPASTEPKSSAAAGRGRCTSDGDGGRCCGSPARRGKPLRTEGCPSEPRYSAEQSLTENRNGFLRRARAPLTRELSPPGLNACSAAGPRSASRRTPAPGAPARRRFGSLGVSASRAERSCLCRGLEVKKSPTFILNTIPGGVQKAWRCGTAGRGLAGMVGMG